MSDFPFSNANRSREGSNAVNPLGNNNGNFNNAFAGMGTNHYSSPFSGIGNNNGNGIASTTGAENVSPTTAALNATADELKSRAVAARTKVEAERASREAEVDAYYHQEVETEVTGFAEDLYKTMAQAFPREQHPQVHQVFQKALNAKKASMSSKHVAFKTRFFLALDSRDAPANRDFAIASHKCEQQVQVKEDYQQKKTRRQEPASYVGRVLSHSGCGGLGSIPEAHATTGGLFTTSGSSATHAHAASLPSGGLFASSSGTPTQTSSGPFFSRSATVPSSGPNIGGSLFSNNRATDGSGGLFASTNGLFAGTNGLPNEIQFGANDSDDMSYSVVTEAHCPHPAAPHPAALDMVTCGSLATIRHHIGAPDSLVDLERCNASQLLDFLKKLKVGKFYKNSLFRVYPGDLPGAIKSSQRVGNKSDALERLKLYLYHDSVAGGSAN